MNKYQLTGLFLVFCFFILVVEIAFAEEALSPEEEAAILERYEELRLKMESVQGSLEELEKQKTLLQGKTKLLESELGTGQDDPAGLGIGKDCSQESDSCKAGLECIQVLGGNYRCAKPLKADEECGRSVLEVCGEGLSCMDAGKKRTVCSASTGSGSKQCFVESVLICKPLR
ncbi:MAG: hypothetical protein ABIG56_05855 [Candidatus Omnitrophota bacterium]